MISFLYAIYNLKQWQLFFGDIYAYSKNTKMYMGMIIINFRIEAAFDRRTKNKEEHQKVLTL